MGTRKKCPAYISPKNFGKSGAVPQSSGDGFLCLLMSLGKEPLSREVGLKGPRALTSQSIRVVESSRVTKPKSLPNMQQSQSHTRQMDIRLVARKEFILGAAKWGAWRASLRFL